MDTDDRLLADPALEIRAERTRTLYRTAPRAQAAALVAATGNVVGLWGAGAPPALLGWLGLVGLLALAQLALARAFRRAPDAALHATRWERRCVVQVSLLGVAWAGFALQMLPLAPERELLLSMTLVALTMGGLAVLGVSAAAFHGFTLPPMAVLIGIFLARGGVAPTTIAALLALCIGCMAAEQRHVAKRVAERVYARLRHEQLTGQVLQAEAALRRSGIEQQLVLDLAPVGILQAVDGLIVRVNAHLLQMLHCTQPQLVGQPLGTLLGLDAVVDAARGRPAARPAPRSQPRELQIRRRDGSLLWVQVSVSPVEHDGDPRGVIAVFADITDRREREAAIQRLAHEDPLTGLPNRRLLHDRMRQAFVQAQRRGRLLAVLLIDLDGFKKINDSHGHEVGDQVLIHVARRLAGGVRGSDTVSRLGSDEFVVLIDDPAGGEDAQLVAEKLIEQIARPIPCGVHTVCVSASVGICMFPRDAQTADAMLRSADAAMYRAKQAGRNAWRLHDEATGSRNS